MKPSPILRNLRISAPGNVDVASADIFRSRLHGMPDYNALRILMGLDSVYSHCTAGTTQDPIECFNFITNNATLALQLQQIYGKISSIDAIVGIHAENVPAHSSVTQTAAAVELNQLKNLRDGDRFFWKYYLSPTDQAFVSSKKMHDVLTTVFPSIAAEISNTPLLVNKNHPCARDSCDSFTVGVAASTITVSASVVDQYGDTNALRQYRVVARLNFPAASNNWRVGIILPSTADKVVSYGPNYSVYNGATFSCANSSPHSFTIKPAGTWSQVQAAGGFVDFEYIATNSANVPVADIISKTRYTTFSI